MKGTSCTTALLNVVEDLILHRDKNSMAFLVLLDHTKAFNTINRKILLNKLRKLFNFSNSAGSLIFVYLLNRCQKVHLNGNISDLLNISRGIPQGLLYSIVFSLRANIDCSSIKKYCNLHGVTMCISFSFFSVLHFLFFFQK